MTAVNPRPDLVVEPFELYSNELSRRGQYYKTVTVRNQGDAVADSTVLRLYRSPDPAVATDDTETDTFPTRSLDAFEEADVQIRLTAPAELGRYYYGLCVDPVPDESDTGNNCSPSVAVDVSLPRPDGLVSGRDDTSLTMEISGSDQTRFELYRSTSETGDYALVDGAIPAKNYVPSKYVDQGLGPDATYYYKAKACLDGPPCSGFSDAWGGVTEASGPVRVPPAPTNVRVVKVNVPNGTDDARVLWEATSRATYYQVYQEYLLGSVGVDGVVSAPKTSYYDSRPNSVVGALVTTRYHVKACNKAGCSGPSRIVEVS